MRLRDQPRNSASCHGAERYHTYSLWCCAGSAPTAPPLPCYPTARSMILPQEPEQGFCRCQEWGTVQDVMSVPQTGHAKGRVQKDIHSVHIFLTIAKGKGGKEGSLGDIKSKRKKINAWILMQLLPIGTCKEDKLTKYLQHIKLQHPLLAAYIFMTAYSLTFLLL